MRKLIVGNWKMNGGFAPNEALIKGFVAEAHAGVDVSVFCPFPYLAQVQGLVKGTEIQFGSQDMSAQASGAYTGEVSVSMLKEFGVTQVIIGHSERRQYHAEPDELVAAVRTAAAGGTPLSPRAASALVERVRVEQVAQLRGAQQLGEEAGIEGEGLGAPLGQGGVALVEERRHVAEQQGLRERRRLVGGGLVDADATVAQLGQHLTQGGHVVHVLQALAHRLEDDREGGIVGRDPQQVCRPLPLLPQRRALSTCSSFCR